MKWQHQLVAWSMVVATGVAGAAETAPTAVSDLTHFFAGLENDCGKHNPQIETVMRWLSTQTGKAPNVTKAPAAIRKALGAGRVTVLDDGDSWYLIAPLRGATFLGAQVVSVERWVGKENGISGIALVFVGSLPAIEKVIGKVKHVQDSEETMPALVIQTASKRAALMCDFSN